MSRIEHGRNIPIDESNGGPLIGLDPMQNMVRQLKSMHPDAFFCYGVAHIRYVPGTGRREPLFISPLFPTEAEVSDWMTKKHDLVKQYVDKNTINYIPPKIRIVEVGDGDTYTHVKLPSEVETELHHGRKGTSDKPPDGMHCVFHQSKKRHR